MQTQQLENSLLILHKTQTSADANCPEVVADQKERLREWKTEEHKDMRHILHYIGRFILFFAGGITPFSQPMWKSSCNPFPPSSLHHTKGKVWFFKCLFISIITDLKTMMCELSHRDDEWTGGGWWKNTNRHQTRAVDAIRGIESCCQSGGR